MARKKKRVEDEEGGDQDVPAKGQFRRFVLTMLFLFIVGYVVMFAAFRTEGLRSFVADRLSTRFNIPVQIGNSSADIFLNLTFTDVRFGKAGGNELGELKFPEVKVRWSMAGAFSPFRSAVELVRADTFGFEIRLQESRSWSPGFAGELTAWLDRVLLLSLHGWSLQPPVAGEVTAADLVPLGKYGGWDRVGYRLRNGTISWMTQDGRRICSLSGVSLDQVPFEIDGRAHAYGKWRAEGQDCSTMSSGGVVELEWVRDAARLRLIGTPPAPAPSTPATGVVTVSPVLVPREQAGTEVPAPEAVVESTPQ